ncbi:MAG: hypothetical protein V2L15_06180 [Desulfobacteraceae bacterium]|jgi:hypothetical protein|nr:hypothetical protein [Desulfobacteraceae bacterium]
MPDIRDCDRIQHADILALNFIRGDAPCVFRRHFRTGLRSRIIEVLDADAAARETRGVMVDGVRCFPRARPVKMLRIFRTRFVDLAQGLHETRRLKRIERWLAPEFLAASEEFYVDYRWGGRRQILLCGLQDYIHGVALDPWQAAGPGYLERLHRQLVEETGTRMGVTPFKERLRENLNGFVSAVRNLMEQEQILPDLAGVRNLVVDADGRLRLVDINNIQDLDFGDAVVLDDKGYPVLDKSLDALDLLLFHFLGRRDLRRDEVLGRFFTPDRRVRVEAAARRFVPP